MTRTTHRHRNIGIIAHVDAGKTTLTERILFYTGRIHAIGEVHEGNTAMDSDPLEQKHGITIRAAAVSADWRGHRLQLLDTPGHLDFTLEVERSLRVLDGAVVVLDGARGVEPQTETVWRQADAHGVARLLFVNKLDRPGASFERALETVVERLGARVLPIVLPWYDEGGALLGVLDVIAKSALSFSGDRGSVVERHPIPEAQAAAVARAKERLVDACAAIDDAFLEEHVTVGEASEQSFARALRRGAVERHFVLALAGAAYADLGVQPLLDAVAAYLPSPLDRPAVIDVTTGEAHPPSAEAPLVAFAFKTMHDEHGARTFIRIYAGVLRKGDTVWLAGDARRVRVGRLVQLFADAVEDIEEARVGEVCALIGARIAAGETLCDPKHPVKLDALRIPEPVVSVSIEPHDGRDRERLGRALSALLSEDPSLRARICPETGETLLSGLGELHVAVAIEHLLERHRCRVRAGEPRVAYRETVLGSHELEYRHIKQSGGPGQFAVVRMRVAAGAPGSGLSIVDAVRGGEIPRVFIAGVEVGVRRAAERGPLSGSPVVDVEVTVLGGSHHPNDSSELAFSIAGEAAFKQALALAIPVLLEPVVTMTVRGPEAAVGALCGELTQRRGRIQSIEAHAGDHELRAMAPLSELFGWTSRARSLSAGRASSTFEVSGYERVPASALKRALERAA
jgi:elongation factor G